MLTLVGTENFKTFKDFSYLKIGKKITLLYGKNSSGKSSILQVLKILNSSFNSPDNGFVYDGVEGELNDFLNKNTKKNSFKIFFDIERENPFFTTGLGLFNFDKFLQKFRLTHFRIGLSIKIKNNINYIDEFTLTCFRISEQKKVPGLGNFIDNGEDKKIIQLKLKKIISGNEKIKIDKNLRGSIFARNEVSETKEYYRYNCSHLIDDDEIWINWYKLFIHECSVGKKPKNKSSRFPYDRVLDSKAFNLYEKILKIQDKSGKKQFNFFKNFLIKDFTSNFSYLAKGLLNSVYGNEYSFFMRMQTRKFKGNLSLFENLNEISYSPKFRMSFSKGKKIIKPKWPERIGKISKDFNTTPAIIDLHLNNITKLIPQILNSANNTIFKNIFIVHSSSSEFKDNYRIINQKLNTVGKFGENTPQILIKNKKILNDLNKILKKSLNLKLIASIGIFQNERYIVFKANDLRGNSKNIKMALAGKGFNSIIPYLTEILMHKNSYILLEEIENSLHPSAVSPLLESLAQLKNNNKYILETHSENIVLKIQQMIKNKILKPDDVSINYVSRNNSGSQIKNISINKDGNFTDSWPEEFFPERKKIILNED